MPDTPPEDGNNNSTNNGKCRLRCNDFCIILITHLMLFIPIFCAVYGKFSEITKSDKICVACCRHEGTDFAKNNLNNTSIVNNYLDFSSDQKIKNKTSAPKNLPPDQPNSKDCILNQSNSNNSKPEKRNQNKSEQEGLK